MKMKLLKSKNFSSAKNIHIDNSYNVWSTKKMYSLMLNAIEGEAILPEYYLNRSLKGMIIEWYLHNIGFWLTLPFITESSKLAKINYRCRHVDLEEHRK